MTLDSLPHNEHAAVLSDNFTTVLTNIARATERRAGRFGDREPTLVAVSKGHPAEALQMMYDLGVRDFGESYVEEFIEKKAVLPKDIQWHFIGRLQSRKAREVVDNVALIHSVDRVSLVDELEKRGTRVQDVLLQIHIGDDANKGGVREEDALALLDRILSCEHLRPIGVMTIPPIADALYETRRYFKELRDCYEALRRHLVEVGSDASSFNEVSMGMSHDYVEAIEEGATMVRVGSALFGPRN